jgi:hypothetical protein
VQGVFPRQEHLKEHALVARQRIEGSDRPAASPPMDSSPKPYSSLTLTSTMWAATTTYERRRGPR